MIRRGVVILMVLLGSLVTLVAYGFQPSSDVPTSLRNAGLPSIATDNPMESVQEKAPDNVVPMLWDNGDTDGSDGYSHLAASVFGFRRALLDDFVVPGGVNWNITGFSWLMIWSNGGVAEGTGAEILFRADAAGSPGAVIATATVTGWSEVATGRTWFSRSEERAQATFDPISLSPGTYWVEFLPIGPDNSFGMVKTAIVGSQGWINYDDLFGGGLHPASVVVGATVDFSWQLLGTAVAAFDLTFLDDLRRSQVCVSSTTGAWQYTALSGLGMGTYTGTGTAIGTMAMNPLQIISSPSSPYRFTLTYWAPRKTASATLRIGGLNSTLSDRNTNDDPPCGGTQPN